MVKNVCFLLCCQTQFMIYGNFNFFCLFLQKNYDFGYAVKEYDEYGNPNVHSRHEVRDGYQVKGKKNFLIKKLFLIPD